MISQYCPLFIFCLKSNYLYISSRICSAGEQTVIDINPWSIFLYFVHRAFWYNDLTNLMHKFFILIRLLYSCTCFEHCCAHLQEENCINTASGVVTIFGWLFSTQVTGGSPPVTCVLNSHTKIVMIPEAVLIQSAHNLCTEQSHKDSGDTRYCVNTVRS